MISHYNISGPVSLNETIKPCLGVVKSHALQVPKLPFCDPERPGCTLSTPIPDFLPDFPVFLPGGFQRPTLIKSVL